MDRFSKFHPAVCLFFFLFVIVITLVYINPVHAALSLVCALLYSLRLLGVQRTAAQLKFSLPLILIAALFNMLFCRYGQTVLFSVFQIGFSLEPLAYGACLGTMLAAVLVWFSAYSEIITSEKFTALFGRFAPNTVLIFSMVLRFLPLMVKTAGEIKEAQQGISKKAGGIIRLIGSKRRTVCSFSYSLCFLCFRLRRSRAARLILCITISCGY